MIKKSLLILSLLLSSLAHAYYGYKLSSYEGEMQVYFFVPANESTAPEHLKKLAQLHSRFMMGSLLGDEKFGYRGTIGNDFSVEDIRVEAADSSSLRVFYTFRGNLVLENQRNLENFKVLLPLRPLEMMAAPKSACAASEYASYFAPVYYQFWTPEGRRCPQEEFKDYLAYSIQLTPRLQGERTYPRYEELVQKGEVELFFYLGSDSETMSRMGNAAKHYGNLKFWLRKKKFRLASDTKKFLEEISPDRKLHSQFLRMEKEVSGVTFRVSAMLGNPLPNTPIAEEEYFRFMKKAYETGSYVYYGGHEGTGDVMDLSRLGQKLGVEVNFPADRYQIYYWDGCLTYQFGVRYFPEMKRGYSNLHFLGNGDLSWANLGWEGLHEVLDAIYGYFDQDERLSYQEIIDAIAKRVKNRTKISDSPMLIVEGDI